MRMTRGHIHEFQPDHADAEPEAGSMLLTHS